MTTTDTMEKPDASKVLVAIEKLTPAILFAEGGVETDKAKGIIGAIARGEIPHTTISY